MFPLIARTPSEGENGMDKGKDEDEDDDEEEEVVYEGRRKQKITIRVVSGEGSRRDSSSSSGCTSLPCCQADECGADLRMARKYNRRHKVCERHAKAPVVLVSGARQRFCQQCSKFHELALFDDTKRSCRERLASHNERRRKAHADLQAGSSEQQQPHGHLK